MTEKEFLNFVGNGRFDIVQALLLQLTEQSIDYCVIGGLAVNAYVEPVVSLDIDIVLAVDDIDIFLSTARQHYTVEQFPHSINLKHPLSALRIQLQTDPLYQSFIAHAQVKKILGYDMRVASIEDVLKGKSWAYLDEERRKSKRQKDLADILRLLEEYPHLKALLPPSLQDL